ncbi:MAG TPA: efflux RND transporter periplasmic adaptor subunit [Planctomycetia bacterium]|nr:efflux RND transporter periplasmic adaptor subunit [Planctomycetia bacterium]
MSKRNRFLVVAGIFGLVAGGAVAYTANSNPATASPTTPATLPRAVRVQEVAAAAATGEQSYTGIVRARYETDLAFRVGAKIASRHVEVGQRVAAGAVLFRLDPTDYRLAVKAAEADLTATEAEVVQSSAEDARMARLQDVRAVSFSERDRARSVRDVALGRRDRAKEALTLARNRLSYCDLTADADGVITALPAEAGQVVAEGQVVARLARDGEREAVVSLPENQAVAARSARAAVSLWAAPGEIYPAVLRELSPTADPVTRTYQARFTVRNPGPKVVLGMTATVHLAPTDAARGYVLPLTALLRAGDRPAVWIVDRRSGAITLTPVEVREYRQETVVLSGGVKPGQLAVTAGVQKLDASMAVRPWDGNP